MKVVFTCVCAIANNQACFWGIELTETIGVTWTFHAITLKGWCLARHSWYM